ncbi:MAG: alpha-amylase [Nitrospirales bacterium]|nr:MAG: alpha-amylase [Nitrospirales bacterium]
MKTRSSAFSSRPHPHLYEINTWVWLHDLSQKMNRPVRLGDVPDHEWDELQSKGFDCLWLMGLWERSPLGRRIARQHADLQKEYAKALPDWQEHEVVGSPYAIWAYQPDPELGSWEQLKEVLEKLHDRGIKLILDFVPNHTALDHEWTTRHPEYYVQGTSRDVTNFPSQFFPIETSQGVRYLAHGKDPNCPAWTDTAQLNYFNPGMRAALLHELGHIAQYCDGVRCDMAMLVLNEVFAQTWGKYVQSAACPSGEFWTEAISLLPDCMWIAEVYWDRKWELQELGFQFTYDKRLYDRLRHSTPHEVALHLQADTIFQSRLVRFLENHDEPRSAVAFGNVRLPAVGVLMATLPGMRLYHQGQLTGKRIRIPVQLCRDQGEPPDEATVAFYDRILAITNDEVFHDGQWTLLPMTSTGDDSFNNVVAYRWTTGRDWRLVVVNLGSMVAQGYIRLDEEFGIEPHSVPDYILYDQFSERSFEGRREDLLQNGLYVRLDPFGCHVFSLGEEEGEMRNKKK